MGCQSTSSNGHVARRQIFKRIRRTISQICQLGSNLQYQILCCAARGFDRWHQRKRHSNLRFKGEYWEPFSAISVNLLHLSFAKSFRFVSTEVCSYYYDSRSIHSSQLIEMTVELHVSTTLLLILWTKIILLVLESPKTRPSRYGMFVIACLILQHL